MSAAELRKAAETLRLKALACEPVNGDDTSASWADEYDAEAHEREHGYFSADIAYIAIMHPGVGLALADWLDEVWAWMEEGVGLLPDSNIGDAWIGVRSHSHEIARLINGKVS